MAELPPAVRIEPVCDSLWTMSAGLPRCFWPGRAFETKLIRDVLELSIFGRHRQEPAGLDVDAYLKGMDTIAWAEVAEASVYDTDQGRSFTQRRISLWGTRADSRQTLPGLVVQLTRAQEGIADYRTLVAPSVPFGDEVPSIMAWRVSGAVFNAQRDGTIASHAQAEISRSFGLAAMHELAQAVGEAIVQAAASEPPAAAA